MLQRLKPVSVCSLFLGTLALCCWMASASKKSEGTALLLSYHLLILFLLPLLVLIWSQSRESIWIGLIFGELFLLWKQSFSFSALFFLLSLTLLLQAVFEGIQKKQSLQTAQTLLPFLFYGSLVSVFLSNEILYSLPTSIRSGFIQGMICSNPLLLLMGSILEQKEFFRFYYMYNTLSDIGSYYPHWFPSRVWVLGISGVLAMISGSILFFLTPNRSSKKNL